VVDQWSGGRYDTDRWHHNDDDDRTTAVGQAGAGTTPPTHLRRTTDETRDGDPVP
jgi:hypothetical protein